MTQFENTLSAARKLDADDALARLRGEFLFPESPSGRKGESAIYLCGNSLGLQPRRARTYIEQELEDWAGWRLSNGNA